MKNAKQAIALASAAALSLSMLAGCGSSASSAASSEATSTATAEATTSTSDGTLDAERASREVLLCDGIPACTSGGATLAAAVHLMELGKAKRPLCIFGGRRMYE